VREVYSFSFGPLDHIPVTWKQTYTENHIFQLILKQQTEEQTTAARAPAVILFFGNVETSLHAFGSVYDHQKNVIAIRENECQLILYSPICIRVSTDVKAASETQNRDSKLAGLE